MTIFTKETAPKYCRLASMAKPSSPAALMFPSARRGRRSRRFNASSCIYHFDRLVSIGAEPHANSLYKHFYYFVTKQQLALQKELDTRVCKEIVMEGRAGPNESKAQVFRNSERLYCLTQHECPAVFSSLAAIASDQASTLAQS